MIAVGVYVLRVGFVMLSEGISALSNRPDFPMLNMVVFILIPIAIVFPFALFWIAIQLLQLVLRVGMLYLSYVEISPDGLEVRQWPYIRARCFWENVEREGKAPSWGASYKFMRLKQAETLPEGRLAMALRGWIGVFRPALSPEHRFTPRSFKGYPNGDLAEAFRQYAPHLFQMEEA